MLQKKAVKKNTVVEGISRRIRKGFEDVAIQLENDAKRRHQESRQEYACLCADIEDLALRAHDCFGIIIKEEAPLTVTNRNPVGLVRYTRVFLEMLIEVKREEEAQLKARRAQNQAALASLNPNNVYQLLARKNIEIQELQEQIEGLKSRLEMATKRSMAVEEMSQSNREQGEDLLKVYRSTFTRVSDLLKEAEKKEAELLQTNNHLNSQLRTLAAEFEMYKKNYKSKPQGKDEQRLRARLEKEYEDKMKRLMKQYENRIKQLTPAH